MQEFLHPAACKQFVSTLSTPFEIIGLIDTDEITLSNKFKKLRHRLLNVDLFYMVLITWFLLIDLLPKKLKYDARKSRRPMLRRAAAQARTWQWGRGR